MVVSVRLRFLLLVFFLSSAARADQFCFLLAENYYQQLYCEVKASGKGAGLPSFYDFRRNDEMMQALLIKQFAGRIGVKVVLPKSEVNNPLNLAPTIRHSHWLNADEALTQRCQRQENSIRCDDGHYHLVGNKSNSTLAAAVLEVENKMALPIYRGAMTDNKEIEVYLNESYHHYLQKMIDIGLGGSTLSYGKFAYLFADLNTKAVDFSERFETMYSYLKKDKKVLVVPAKSTVPDDLNLDDCYPLKQLLVCGAAMNNWIFKKQPAQ